MTAGTLSTRYPHQTPGASDGPIREDLPRPSAPVDRNAWGEYSVVPTTFGDANDLRERLSAPPARHSEPAPPPRPATGPSWCETPAGQGAAAEVPAAGAITAELLPIVQQVSRLAMALSEASFRQGQLEEQVRHLDMQAQDAESREQVAIDRATTAEAELEQVRYQLADAEYRLQAPWWRRLFGG